MSPTTAQVTIRKSEDGKRVHAVATIKGVLEADGTITSKNGIRWIVPMPRPT